MADDTLPRSDHEATGPFSDNQMAAIKDLIFSSLKDMIKPTNEGESEGGLYGSGGLVGFWYMYTRSQH